LQVSYLFCNAKHEIFVLCQWVQHINRIEEVADDDGITLLVILVHNTKVIYASPGP